MPGPMSEHPFRRERVAAFDRNLLIVRSTCKRCGEAFSLDVRDGIDEAEAAHLAICKKKAEPVSIAALRRRRKQA